MPGGDGTGRLGRGKNCNSAAKADRVGRGRGRGRRPSKRLGRPRRRSI